MTKVVGRPRVDLSKDQLAQVEALAAYLSTEQISDYLGVGRTTFWAMMNRNPEILERYKRGKAKAIESVATGLLAKAQSGDTLSAIFYLKTQAGWRETQHLDHSSTDGSMQPQQIIIRAATNSDNPVT